MSFTLSPNILALPIALPLFTAALLLLFSRWGLQPYTLQGNRLVLQMGLWPAPYGITVICDALSATMLTVTSILALAILPFAVGTMDSHRKRLGYFPLSLVLMMGVNGAFLTGDIFNLYVFFEVLLMASFVLLTLGGTPSQINGGIRYVVLNLLASIMLLTAAGVAYGTVGTLNMAHLAVRLEDAPTFIKYVLAGLLLVAFGSKAAVFPLFFWLPSSYHTPHPAVTALFGGILTKVGIYTLIRTFTLLLPTVLVDWQPVLLILAGLTMFIGVLGAFAQPTIRRLLSFHIISQVGYMIMGLAIVASPTSLGAGFALAATLIFVIHNMLVKTALMMGGGAVEPDGHRRRGQAPAPAGVHLLRCGLLAGRRAPIQRLRRQAEPAAGHVGYPALLRGRRQRAGQPVDDHEHDPALAVLILGTVQAGAGALFTAAHRTHDRPGLGAHGYSGGHQPGHGHLLRTGLPGCHHGG